MQRPLRCTIQSLIASMQERHSWRTPAGALTSLLVASLQKSSGWNSLRFIEPIVLYVIENTDLREGDRHKLHRTHTTYGADAQVTPK